MNPKLNALPAAIRQIIESVQDPTIPEHIKFNHIQTLENIREQCDLTIKRYYNKGTRRK